MNNGLLGITILAVFSLIVGIFSLLGSIGFLILSVLPLDVISNTLSNLQAVVELISILLFFFGILFVFLSFGLLGKKRWGWTLGVVLFVLILFVSIGATFMMGSSLLIEGALSFVCLVYLMSPEVKSYFRKMNSTVNLGNIYFSDKRESPDKKN
jgi:hypothetical protein